MLKKLINQIREQIRLARVKRNIRQTELERIRDRHLRRHRNQFTNPS
ncbi:MAG: hypothetical protein HC929_21070 [Leptolyngbyaceae cyanobacterium SM2_5_2]|nr:hypothetical protein [Leptolyngbyaceae cyanobacterium SM2_5_2]